MGSPLLVPQAFFHPFHIFRRPYAFMLLVVAVCCVVDGGVLLVRGQDGAAADAIKAEVAKLQAFKADLATATAAAESASTFDRKGDACCCCCCCCCRFLLLLVVVVAAAATALQMPS